MYGAGAKTGCAVAIRKKLKCPNAVEPVIGHMKTDEQLGLNFLKGTHGNAMNARSSAQSTTGTNSAPLGAFVRLNPESLATSSTETRCKQPSINDGCLLKTGFFRDD